MDITNPVNLENICGGAPSELFDHELQQLLANIADINTDADKRRSITLKFDFKPLADRTGASISFSVNSKLVPVSAVKSTIFLGRKDGKLAAYSPEANQVSMFDRPDDGPSRREPTKVVTLKP
jgi:hypothetical protein